MNFLDDDYLYRSWASISRSYPSITWGVSPFTAKEEIEKALKKEEEPILETYSRNSEKSMSKECLVVCTNRIDLTQERILKNLSIMKSNLMIQCAPIHLKKIECTMTSVVKENIIMAWRKLNMYGKKTPFVARFDEYGRRLPDEIKIETLSGMTIKIVSPEEHGEYYLEFKGIISDISTSPYEDVNSTFTYKKDPSVFDDDLPF